MKVQKKHAGWALAGALLVGSVFTLVAWTGNPHQPQDTVTQTQDTVPSKQRQKVTRQPNDRDFDYELRQLDNAQFELADVDWEKISRDVEKALKDIDFQKIQLQAMESVQKIDFEKISKQVEESLKAIDFDKIEKDLKGSLDAFDKEEVQKELKEAREQVEKELKRADWKKDIEEAKKINKLELDRELEKVNKEMEKVKEELKAEKFNFKEEMKKAGAGIEKAKEEVKGYQEMVYAMESDGLLSTKEDYTIKYDNGELIINGKKQPADVTNKYKKYFPKDKVTIKKEDGDIDINHGNSKDHIDI